MNKKYIIRLTGEERQELGHLINIGKTQAYRIKHANILLAVDADGPGWSDEQAAEAFRCHGNTVRNVRQRLVEQGMEAALARKPQEMPSRQRIFDGEKEARLLAIACSAPPEGRATWTLTMLADTLVALGVVDSVSAQTVRRTLKKNELRPHVRKCWVIPPEQDAEFVAGMEDILDMYTRPYDPAVPVVCMDEQPTQLIKETHTPLPAEPGIPERYDYEYERNGTAVNFMFTEPLAGWRKVNVRDRRTGVDWAHEIRHLLAVEYPDVRKVLVVCDNLNTHKPASFYEAFPPEEARRLLTRLELHYTPKHGSWLNIAEIELSVFTRQCLDRRIPDRETLSKEAKIWERKRNSGQKSVDWQFTTDDARIRLKRLYPQIQMS